MKLNSAAADKGFVSSTAKLYPRKDSRTRRMYDLLINQKGVPIEINLSFFEGKNSSALIEQLCNCYGLDIRRLSNKKWVLAGEWFEDSYVDYIANKVVT